MGQFETKYDLNIQPTKKDSMRYAKLIGPSNDEHSLQNYSSILLKQHKVDQLAHFPNSSRVIDS